MIFGEAELISGGVKVRFLVGFLWVVGGGDFRREIRPVSLSFSVIFR
jgi:hypothetical protein